jgi:hypothetical protein
VTGSDGSKGGGREEMNGIPMKDKDSQHVQRSSRRISSMGAAKKSVSFGCVLKSPWFPESIVNKKPTLNGSSSIPPGIEGTENLGPLSEFSLLSGAIITLYTGNLEEELDVPVSCCCKVISEDTILFLLMETGYSLPKTVDKVNSMAESSLKSQWREEVM